MNDWVDVATLEKISPGERATLMVDGAPVVVFNVGGELFAVEDACTHEAYPLSDGEIDGETLTCAMHGAQFSLRTGEVLEPASFEPVAIDPVRVPAGRVQVGRERRE